MFWKKKPKKVKLTFHTKSTGLLKMFPPKIGTSYLPNWYYNSDPEFQHATTRSCVGLNDMLKKVISVPLWTDITFRYDKDEITGIHIPGTSPDMIYHTVTHHSPLQYQNAFKGAHHFKLMNPWLITSDECVPFMMVDATWHRDNFDKYTVLPGNIEFKYQTGAHINCFIHPTRQPSTLKLNGGDIFCYLVPLEPVEIELEYKKVTHEEWQDLLPYAWTEKSHYRRSRKLMEKNDV